MNLNIEKKYKVVYKKYFFQKELCVDSFIGQEAVKVNDKEFYNSKFCIYGFKIDKVISDNFLMLKSEKSILNCKVYIYEVQYVTGEEVRIMEICDIDVDKKYRSKRIGSQIIKILAKIAEDNDIKYMVGELQKDGVEEPLNRRKKFFEKNGFVIQKNDKSEFSGWIAKKNLL